MLCRFMLFVVFFTLLSPAYAYEAPTNKANLYTFPLKTIEYIDINATDLTGHLQVFLPSENVISCELPVRRRFALARHIHPYLPNADYAAGYPVAVPIYGFLSGYNKPMQFENGRMGVRLTLNNQKVLFTESYLFVPSLYDSPMPGIPMVKDTRSIMSLNISATLNTFETRGLAISVMGIDQNIYDLPKIHRDHLLRTVPGLFPHARM